jgi:hypothetical protein
VADIARQCKIPKTPFINKFRTFLFLASKLKKFRQCPTSRSSDICILQDVPTFSINFRQKDWNWRWLCPWDRLQFTFDTISFTACSDFKTFSTKWLQLNDTDYFHVKCFFVNLSPNCTHQTCFTYNPIWGPVSCHPHYFIQGSWSSTTVSHTLKNNSFPFVVPCKLFRTASSLTTSKGFDMPQILTINNWTVMLPPLLSSSVKQKASNSFALILSYLNHH